MILFSSAPAYLGEPPEMTLKTPLGIRSQHCSELAQVSRLLRGFASDVLGVEASVFIK
jgi:hypothetical protein